MNHLLKCLLFCFRVRQSAWHSYRFSRKVDEDLGEGGRRSVRQLGWVVEDLGDSVRRLGTVVEDLDRLWRLGPGQGVRGVGVHWEGSTSGWRSHV